MPEIELIFDENDLAFDDLVDFPLRHDETIERQRIL